MNLPAFTSSPLSIILYFLLLVIIALGLYQFIRSRYILKKRETMRFRDVTPLGWASFAFAFMGLFNHYSEAFSDIEAAGDISPSIVASAMEPAFGYPTLGCLCLAISYVFRFVNQYETLVK